jgi:NAD(P)-dependent dehydrogenase (short-subunit alcohol dehydrogenase family)
MAERFAGKVALVTGATSGIGAAIARRLAAEGARVAFCGFAEAPERHVAALGGPDRARHFPADLRRPADCRALVDATLGVFGRLDVLVNNAASVARGTLETTTVDDFDALIALNLRAPFLLAQRALPAFKAQFAREGTGGAIINIGSVNAYIGEPKLLVYSASKGGLMTLSRNLARALAPWRVRVHVLNLGWVRTEGEEVVQRQEGAPADWAERAGASLPLGRLLAPEEIAAAVAFYASDEAAAFSGAAVDLDQGPV